MVAFNAVVIPGQTVFFASYGDAVRESCNVAKILVVSFAVVCELVAGEVHFSAGFFRLKKLLVAAFLDVLEQFFRSIQIRAFYR